MEGRKLSSNLKKELEDEMDRSALQNELEDRGRFVSDCFVSELLTEENLAAHLRKEYNLWPAPWGLPEEYRALSTAIRTNGQILYCILILLDRQRDIHDLLYQEPAWNDRTLFGRDQTGHRSFCSREQLKKIPQFDDETAELFYKVQWCFPPTLWRTGEIPKFDLQHFKLPFNQVNQRLGRGGFGIVYGNTMRKEYLRHCETDNSVLSIAYKRIILPTNDTAKQKRLCNEVTVLRNRAHPGVTDVLGSFIAGLEVQATQRSTQECLYIIYPRAEKDMDKWLQSTPNEFLISLGEDREDLDQHIYGAAMFGLASGLAWLHCEIDGHVGYHRDLKPKNVLLFREKTWKWKIADFGTANVKPVEDTGTKSWTTTSYWAPPEYFEEWYKGDQNGKTHGRSHDIYSLGCIFLLLATLIAHGWSDAGIPSFERRRLSGKPEQPTDDVRSDSVQGAFHDCGDAVTEWIQELEAHYRDNERLNAVLKVIREMLLPYENRISAWEVDVYLYEATEQWRLDMKASNPENPTMSKHAMVVRRLQKVAQESREIDMNMKVTPLSRAKEWERSDDFLLALKEKKWIDSSPQMSGDLKRRREMSGDPKRRQRGSAKLISTLPPDTSQKDPLFGYQNEFDEIALRFGNHNVVVLWGLGGIGKSRMALFYASQFTKSNSPERKHTFWVSMADSETIREGYQKIAKMTGASAEVLNGGDTVLVKHIEDWLQDAKSEEWILILDGLDTGSQLEKIAVNQNGLLDLRKIDRCGQILITARSRVCVAQLSDQYERLQLKPPGIDNCLRIYDHFIDKSLFAMVDQNTKDLLESLALPKLVKEAVRYMNLNMISPSVLSKTINAEEFRGVHELSPRLLDYLLGHLSSESSTLDYSRIEIQKLFILAMFREGASFELLSSELEKDELPCLQSALGVLQNSALVYADDGPNRDVYRVEKTVQAALWAYISREEGALSLLQRFNKMLSMLYRYYDRSTCKDKDDFMTFIVNEKLALNLDRFLKFTKSHHGQYPYKIDMATRSVLAIIEFARALCDQDRYEDAIKVLDFARDHCCQSQRTPERKRYWIRYKLEQQRMKTYLSRPAVILNHSPNLYWTTAERIVTNLLEDASSSSISTDHSFEDQIRKWDLSLDLVRVRYYLKKWDEAKKALDSIADLNITFSDVPGQMPEPILSEPPSLRSGINGTDDDRIRIEENRWDTVRNIAARRYLTEGLFHLEKGQYAEARGDKSEAKRSWELAKEALNVAKIALIWWPGKGDMHAEVLVYLADVDTKLGTKRGLEQALRTFETALKSAKNKYGSNCMRVWDMQRRINAVRLKTGCNLDMAVSSLEGLLGRYEDRFGSQAAPTVRCANQLMEAYMKTNRRRDAETLSTRTQTRLRSDVGQGEDWAVSGAVVIVACGIGCMWWMRRGNFLPI